MKRVSLITVVLIVFVLMFSGCATTEKVAKDVVVAAGSSIVKDVVTETKVAEKVADVKKEVETLYVKVTEVVKKTIALGKSTKDLWSDYNKAKVAADNSTGEEKVGNLIDKLKWSAALNRKDIAVWQYNNIAYEYILMFEQLRDKKLLVTAKPFIEKAIDMNSGLGDSLNRKETLEKNKAYIEEYLK